MTEQRFIFDEVAELYDRVRPRYPAELFDELVSIAGLAPGDRILEIGCGTGQATRSLLERGFRVLSLEPGPAMAACARERLAGFDQSEIVGCTFEDWPLEREGFALVVSAQAFHWVDEAIRFAKAADALRPGGSLAVVGNAAALERSELREEIDAVYAREAPALGGAPPTRWYGEEGPLPDLFAASGRFGPLTARCHPWSRVYSATEYCDLLRTHSHHRLLPEEQREALLSSLAELVRAKGDRIELGYDAHLYVASRV